MKHSFGLPFKDIPLNSLILFVLGMGSVFLANDQFSSLIEGQNPQFLFVLMIIGPGCLFAVSFITTFAPSLCRTHLLLYVAFITGVEISVAVYLGLTASTWYQQPHLEHLEPTVVSLSLVLGCLQWSKNKWEQRVKVMLSKTSKQDS